jgi:hypothetical protein
LSKRLHLEGSWEVGLCEIHYTRSWPNLVDGGIDAYVTNRNAEGIKSTAGRPVVLSPGYYDDINALLTALNGKTVLDWAGRTDAPYKFTYENGRVHVTLQAESTIHLSECLRCILGFQENWLEHPGSGVKKIKAGLPPDLNRGVACLYVYTDVVEPRLVGDSTARLLRVIPVKGKQGDMTSLDMRKVHYVDMSNGDFDNIEILICDDNGQVVPFAAGRVVVTLHLREKNRL